MEPKFIYFESYGCCANQNNAEIMKGLVRQTGLELTSNPDIADLLVLNTCIVKEPTEKKIERRISDLRKLNKPIIIAGCMPEVRQEKLREKNLYLLGAHHIKDITKLIRKIYEGKYDEEEFLSLKYEEKLCLPKISSRKEIGITQILEGCLGNCSFCLVKLTKHKLFSYPEEKILENIERDLKSGAKEIWLTSQDNASYGLDEGKRLLPTLMKKFLNLRGRFKIRLGMMNPENVLPILPQLIKIYKHEKMKPFLHLPLQSGSDKILKKMNRRYKASDFLFIVEKFRKEIPDLFLSTDIIVGFPGETEEDFEKSLEIIRKIRPQQLNLSRYWAMKGTDAAEMKQVSIETAKSRARKLMQVYREIKQKQTKQ
jgi:MiaB-like tRNA modifying enzyme